MPANNIHEVKWWKLDSVAYLLMVGGVSTKWRCQTGSRPPQLAVIEIRPLLKKDPFGNSVLRLYTIEMEIRNPNLALKQNEITL